MGGKKKYIKMFGSFTEPFITMSNLVALGQAVNYQTVGPSDRRPNLTSLTPSSTHKNLTLPNGLPWQL